ncbi:MAG TPA: alpha/beta hydrolase [Caulobacteraceae bacterium]|nr:alpha/beta hydrolase [Caulobacteraceae bacterium]
MSDLIDASHRLALKTARRTIKAGIAGLDRRLPALADLTTLDMPGPAGPLEGRLYRPEGVAEDAPLLVFFHGGGFVVSDLESHEAMCIRLAAAGRFRLLAAAYRLAPEHRYPAQIDDALAVARWATGEGRAVIGSGGRIALGGDSAGGYLAALTAARLHAELADLVSAQVLIYPLLEMRDAAWADDLFDGTRAVGWAAMKYVRSALAAEPEAPSFRTASDIAPIPTLIATGGPLDPCRGHAAALVETLKAANRSVVALDYPPLVHGFGSLTHLSPTARRALDEIGAAAGALLRP